MQKDEFNQGLLNFLDLSPTPFHAVETMKAMLESAGFQPLAESQQWSLAEGERYYVVRNDSSCLALVRWLPNRGFDYLVPTPIAPA